MDITGIGSVLDFGGKLIDRIWPDPAQRDAAKLELFKAQQAGEFKQMDQVFQLAQDQISVNTEEAKSPSLLVSGWRPALGWVCVTACAWNWIGLPIVIFAASALGRTLNLAPADISQMWPILIGMLGLGGLRTAEKINGVAAK